MSREPRIAGLRRTLQMNAGARGIVQEIDAELRFHLDTRRDELMAGGFARDDAERLAREEFGDVVAARDDLARVDRRRHDHERRADWTEALAQDIRYALRGLRAAPGFAIAVVLTLALGIGTNAAMFQIADRLLFQPPAQVARPDQLATIVLHEYYPREHSLEVATRTSYPALAALGGAPAVAGLAVRNATKLSVSLNGAAWSAPVELVSPNYFTLLGAIPQRGRLFSASADSSGATPGVVISDQLWRTRLGQDPNVLGRLMHVAGGAYPIVGIATKGFTGAGLESVDCWLPADQAPALGVLTRATDWKTPNSFWLSAVARVRTGVPPTLAESQLTLLLRHWLEANPYRPVVGNPRDTLSFVTLAPLAGLREDAAERPAESRVAAWLAALSALVLLIACANVAGLLLVRALRRSREFALRRALGMSRGRLIGQLLVESGLLAITGAVAAVLALHWTTPLLRNLVAPRVLWGALPVRADFLLAITTVAGVLFVALVSALLPARLLGKADVGGELKPAAHTTLHGRGRTQAVLVAAQVALCLALLAVAGVFVQSLRRVRAMDYGFSLDAIAAEMSVSPNSRLASNPAIFARAAEAVRRIPGVREVAMADESPFRSLAGGGIALPGRPQASLPRVETGGPYAASVTPGYFSALETPIVRGRPFLPSDTVRGATPVAIVNESIERLYWPGQSAVGRCVYVNSGTTCTTVVGIARDMRRMFVREDPRLEFFLPLSGAVDAYGQPRTGMTLLIRADNPVNAMPAIQRALQALDPAVPFADVNTLRSRLNPQTQSWLLGATMMSGFAVLALILAAIGLYSVVSYMVASQAHDVGVRLAIGASRAHVVGLFVRRGLGIALAGVACGAVASLLIVRRVADLLFETSPMDPIALGGAIGLLLLTVVLASLIPSVRASRLDPLQTLRVD